MRAPARTRHPRVSAPWLLSAPLADLASPPSGGRHRGGWGDPGLGRCKPTPMQSRRSLTERVHSTALYSDTRPPGHRGPGALSPSSELDKRHRCPSNPCPLPLRQQGKGQLVLMRRVSGPGRDRGGAAWLPKDDRDTAEAEAHTQVCGRCLGTRQSSKGPSVWTVAAGPAGAPTSPPLLLWEESVNVDHSVLVTVRLSQGPLPAGTQVTPWLGPTL